MGGRSAHTPLLEEIRKVGEGGVVNHHLMQPFELILKQNFTQKVSLLMGRAKSLSERVTLMMWLGVQGLDTANVESLHYKLRALSLKDVSVHWRDRGTDERWWKLHWGKCSIQPFWELRGNKSVHLSMSVSCWFFNFVKWICHQVTAGVRCQHSKIAQCAYSYSLKRTIIHYNWIINVFFMI